MSLREFLHHKCYSLKIKKKKMGKKRWSFKISYSFRTQRHTERISVDSLVKQANPVFRRKDEGLIEFY